MKNFLTYLCLGGSLFYFSCSENQRGVSGTEEIPSKEIPYRDQDGPRGSDEFYRGTQDGTSGTRIDTTYDESEADENLQNLPQGTEIGDQERGTVDGERG